jgi:predicted transcriptional regulator
MVLVHLEMVLVHLEMVLDHPILDGLVVYLVVNQKEQTMDPVTAQSVLRILTRLGMETSNHTIRMDNMLVEEDVLESWDVIAKVKEENKHTINFKYITFYLVKMSYIESFFAFHHNTI